MITKLGVRGYGCLKDVTATLTSLHAFIGPNDSGKSTLLRALMNGMTWASSGVTPNVLFDWLHLDLPPFDFDWTSTGTPVFVARATGRTFPYKLHRLNGTLETRLGRPLPEDIATRLDSANTLNGARLCRFDPDDLRRETPLIPEGTQLTLSERGSGLPSVYDAILSRGDQSFYAIADEVRRLFPTIKSLRLKAVSQSTKTFEIELTDGQRVGANQFSEGLLYYLAFAALPYLQPVSLLLVEEPENGLHPARVAEVMRVLREISKTTQVVVATHSPLVINELQAEEVSVVTRTPEQGTQVRLLKDTPNFEQRSKIYALGELWLSYANGIDEAPLFKASEKP